jgi:hypothetical protein
MKGITSHIILILLPIILFIIVFYLTANALSREIEVSDISSKILNFINEAENLKLIVLEKIKNEKKDFNLLGKYCNLNVRIISQGEKIKYEIEAKPREEIGIKISLLSIGEIKV